MTGKISENELPQITFAHAQEQHEEVEFASLDYSIDTSSRKNAQQSSELKSPRQKRRKSKQQQTTATKEKLPILPVDEEVDQEEELTPGELFHRWLISFASLSCVLSFLFHSAILIVLSVIVLNQVLKEEQIVTVVNTEENDEPGDVIEDMDTKLSGGAELQEVKLPSVQFIQTDHLLQQPQAQLDMQIPSLDGAGDNEADGSGKSGFKFAMPNTDKVVRKGSFTAWTVPEDPLPNQDYIIIIQIELPKRIRRYPRGDLSGKVVGTDFYFQPIPGRGPRTLPIRKNKVQLQIKVPGAAQLVRDTISIESKLLKESQKLEIVF